MTAAKKIDIDPAARSESGPLHPGPQAAANHELLELHGIGKTFHTDDVETRERLTVLIESYL